MLVTSYLPIQTTKIFYSFLTITCAPPLRKTFRHPWLVGSQALRFSQKL